MSETVNKIFDKLDNLAQDMATIKANTTSAAATSADHEQRLRGLEQWKWWVLGISTAVGTVGGVAIAVFCGK